MVYSFNLSGKVVVITGGYGHLGKAITESLLFHGATVWVLGLNRNKFERAFEKLEIGRDRLKFNDCDILKTVSIQKAFESVFDQSGTMDVLINNAFFMTHNPTFSMDDSHWDRSIDGTLSSVFRCIREAVPYLKKSTCARIINVSSTLGMIAPDSRIYNKLDGVFKPPQYGVCKAGVIQLTKYYASYLGEDGITVNTVTPGPFPADRIQKNEAFIEKLVDKTMLKRVGIPEDIAGAFVFLTSDASNYMTGHNLVVDGGYACQ